jgi:Mg2+-importing ATPase
MAVQTMPSDGSGSQGGAPEPRRIYKGAAGVLLEHCLSVHTANGAVGLDRYQVNGRLAAFEEAGARVIAVAEAVDPRQAATAGDPGQLPALMLIGLLGLADPPRASAGPTLARAGQLGISVKIVTGDARARAVALAKQLDLTVDQNAIVSAEALRDGQPALAEQGRIFADVEPADKFKLVRLLQEHGHRVAVTGDGVNDAPALTTANVGLALASGSNAAKQSADLVLVEDDLRVIIDGIQEGRRTFTTINRYLVYTLVSNFATVFVVTIASYLLPELPLLPAQVLLLTILPDLSMLAIATDGVAAEDLRRAQHWRIRTIVTVAFWFGIVNTLYTFGLLRVFIHAPVPALRSALFMYLALTALLVLVNVRTPNWSWQAPRPSRAIAVAVAGSLVVPFALINLPPLRAVFGFGPLPPLVQLGIIGLTVAYVATLDVIKWVLRHPAVRGRTPGRPRTRSQRPER